MTDVVTRLVVRADGSLATLDRFEKGMSDAGKATDYTSGAVASFEARMEAARQAIERGNAVATQTVARKSQEERAWEKWSATVDRTAALRIRLERESTQAAAAAANAVNMGYASQEQALNTLMALERRHAAQLSAHIAAENNVALAYNRTAQAADQAALSTQRLSAANQNGQYRGAQSFNTANVAAQFQDIGVTAAMGMSPLQIALQQGTQLSAVLGGQGLTGVVKTLGAAFASILSPVSLLTIGVVALVAWGIQAFSGIGKEADDATTAVERHNATLDNLLSGYDRVRDAAHGAFDAAMKLPEGVIASDLRATLREQEDAQIEMQRRIEANRSALAETADFLRQIQDIGRAGGDDPTGMDAAVRQIDLMRQLAIDTGSTRDELEAAMVAAREMYNTADDPALKDMADQAYQLALQLMAIQAQADSASAALNAIPRSIQVRLEFNNAMGEMRDLYMDPRSRFDIARENLDNWSSQATATAQTYSELKGVGDEYVRVLDSINAAEAKANEKAGRGAASKPFDQWKGNVESFQQRIASQRMEIELLGQSTYEAERQKAAFDLLNQAKQAGIPITSEVTDQINLMSSEYAAATVELERQAEAQRAAEEQMNFYRSTFVGFFGDLKSGLKDGQSFWEALGNAGVNALDRIADRALSMAANGIFDMIFGSIMGGITGGFGSLGNGIGAGAGSFSNFTSLMGVGHNANGTDNWRGGLSWVGERGPELLNLPRGAQVIPHRQSMAMAANQNGPTYGDLIIQNTMQVMPGATEEDGAAFARGFTREMKRQGPDFFKQWQKNDLRRTG
ncbi:phage tail length tape measure family protein [Devosia sp. Root635]|uniref:phage tail length tape measure family protein n=1 Tax=Devosia sp. Root635 TaxID=1736575 RepID=UPI0006FBBC77|nr:phage tail length tape measure family protein [Devosia sp. Root635]KRA42091.1 hypothetical protein ASD80_10210 [Devosia sp. Root635]